MSGEETIYVDATDQIAGRLSSKVAKVLLSGRRVVVVNSEKALVSGSRTSVVNQWKERLELASRVNPIYGPIHPRRPDNILRRMVRGMVPRKKPKGAAAMKRLRVYIGVPEGVDGSKLTKFDDAAATRPIPIYVTMADLSKSLGWNE
ncbi:MAG: 50S ribosomal protein L13 [Nitrososphaerota archaeon]|nr:50S ribosomal protein L13 [Nitrososphaerota archaeon]MDG6974535.1 50S ribosomal protein L13 [Nitrososphaerota archaeon]MDG7009455.1 50S ribosomal protein L13 [Nitrososphaerota archaeon]MDG7019125.1 50S ribosomal protein L13 [Nitrososphaerota archaeon]MDG7027532.1 50S ribosomal protein L13 [Nitrososphaerota archaeon]